MPQNVLKLAKEENVEFVDFRFLDFIGAWQHFSVPVGEVTEEVFEDGLGFDGSSIRAWQPIHASDMLVIPDPTTAKIDPFYKRKTLALICNIFDPITREAYSRDPRNIAQKAEAYMKSTGIADTAYFGPEPEFFIFDDIRYSSEASDHSFYFLDSIEGAWNTGTDEGPNQGYKPTHKGGYFPTPPIDKYEDIRADMSHTLGELGIIVERQHHEVATAGQCEIATRFASLVAQGDQLMWLKHVVKNTAYQQGKTATFMPKPLYNDNGNGMHCHQSIWKDGKPLFAGDGYGGLSELALHYIGGLLKHAKALNAFTNPSTNSYKRLVPGFEAPIKLAYSARNRSASVRIPVGITNPKAKRIELRFPDPSCNGYLAFSAMLMAGLDGIQNKIDPGEALDKDIYGLSPEESAGIPSCCTSLGEALDALKADHEFLLKGDVFTEDVISKWIEYKNDEELEEVNKRPHPKEFELYFDC